jgi:hypothetical protein
MAIVVLVLWLFTAGAGFYLLVTSSLGRARPAAPQAAATDPQPARASAGQPAPASGQPAPASGQLTPASAGQEASRREMRRAARNRWDPPSLTAAKKAPMLPGARSLMEFAHPACALIGLACWLGFTMIHNRALGWIAFALIAVTACLGLAWFTANVRAARRGDGDRPAPYFVGRLMVLHGSAAAVTITLAALTALVTQG